MAHEPAAPAPSGQPRPGGAPRTGRRCSAASRDTAPAPSGRCRARRTMPPAASRLRASACRRRRGGRRLRRDRRLAGHGADHVRPGIDRARAAGRCRRLGLRRRGGRAAAAEHRAHHLGPGGVGRCGGVAGRRRRARGLVAHDLAELRQAADHRAGDDRHHLLHHLRRDAAPMRGLLGDLPRQLGRAEELAERLAPGRLRLRRRPASSRPSGWRRRWDCRRCAAARA